MDDMEAIAGLTKDGKHIKHHQTIPLIEYEDVEHFIATWEEVGRTLWEIYEEGTDDNDATDID